MTKAKAKESSGKIAWGRYLLIFFIAAWMFILGILVGRRQAPVYFDTLALQEELAALRDAADLVVPGPPGVLDVVRALDVAIGEAAASG